jgi:hypothetical protein
MIAMCAGASLLLPGWLADWREGTSSYVNYTAGVPPHIQVIFGKYAGGAVGLVLIVGVAILCWKTRRDAASSDRFRFVSVLILVVSLAVTPLWHEYDQLFVVPAILLAWHWRAEFQRLHPLAQAFVILSGIALLWHWISAIALVVLTHATAGVPQSWQIFPWLPVFFAPTLVLISLILIARKRFSFQRRAS